MYPMGEQYAIAAAGAEAVITEVGAGLRAFEVDGVPYTESYPADASPPMGAGHVLVPWPNRVAGARWAWRGRTYDLEATEPARGHAIHGLVRHVPWRVSEHSEATITLGADVTAGPGWPQPLAVTVTYAVAQDTGLTVTHTVTDTGDDDAPVGLGVHPYPRVGDTPTDDLVLTLAADTVLDVDEALIPTGQARPVRPDEDFRGGRPLRGAALDTAFGGCTPAPGDAHVVHELRAPGGDGVRLWADPAFAWVQVFTPDAVDVEGGPRRAVAVEPMTCPPDALNSHVDLRVLAPGETWTLSWGLMPLRGDR